MNDPDLNLAYALARSIAESGGRLYLAGEVVWERLARVSRRHVDVVIVGLPASTRDALLPDRVSVSHDPSMARIERDGARVTVLGVRDDHRDDRGPEAWAREHCALTIDAILLDPLTGRWLDPQGGLRDLESGRLRHVGPALAEDAASPLRLAGLTARLGFEVEVDRSTLEVARRCDVRTAPQARRRYEVDRWLVEASEPARGLDAFVDAGAARAVLGETSLASAAARAAVGARLDRAARVRRTSSNPLEFMIAALVADLEVDVERAARALGFDDAASAIERRVDLAALAGPLAADAAVTDGVLRRVALVADVAELARLAHAIDGGDLDPLIRRAEAANAVGPPPAPFLVAEDLLALGLPEGRAFDQLLDEAFDRQLDGEFRDAGAARAFARDRVLGESGSASRVVDQ